MKILKTFLAAALFLLPISALAAGPQYKVFTGTVTQINGGKVTVKTAAGQIYFVETGAGQIIKKNGSPMKLSEVLMGDKVEVKGTLYSDNSFLSASFRNLSLYAHNGTFSGKIVMVSPAATSFTLQTSAYGLINVHTDALTNFKISTGEVGLVGLKTDMSATVKGAWERSRSEVLARTVDAKFRLVGVEFTGTLRALSSTGLTVVVGNTLYGVDISKSVIKNKSGQTINWNGLVLGQSVHVTGKHASGSSQISASLVKVVSY